MRRSSHRTVYLALAALAMLAVPFALASLHFGPSTGGGSAPEPLGLNEIISQITGAVSRAYHRVSLLLQSIRALRELLGTLVGSVAGVMVARAFTRRQRKFPVGTLVAAGTGAGFVCWFAVSIMYGFSPQYLKLYGVAGLISAAAFSVGLTIALMIERRAAFRKRMERVRGRPLTEEEMEAAVAQAEAGAE